MRFRHPDGTLVHLSYCTNVHAAEDLDGVLAQLTRYGEPIRERLGVPQLGLGLWLAAPVVAELAADPAAAARLRRELAHRGLEVVTLNAFPYQGFQQPVVKHAVYQPDWTNPVRLHYTLACARILAALLPSDADYGSISTLPAAWRRYYPADGADQVRRHLGALASGLARLAADTGRTVRVGLEPEPGCVAETTAQVAQVLSGVDPQWIGMCADACHLAVAFEDPRAVTAAPPIVKAQVSCALHAAEPAEPRTRAALAAFIEPRFLHQTSESGTASCDDLPQALAGALPARAPWRVHFHVPVHAEVQPPLRTTRPELVATLEALLAGPSPYTRHLEVETYTWPVLPGAPTSLVAGISAELAWTRDTLATIGLKEERE